MRYINSKKPFFKENFFIFFLSYKNIKNIIFIIKKKFQIFVFNFHQNFIDLEAYSFNDIKKFYLFAYKYKFFLK